MPSGLLPKRGVQHVCRRTVAVARAEEAGRHDRFAQRQEVSGEAKGEAKGEKKEKKSKNPIEKFESGHAITPA